MNPLLMLLVATNVYEILLLGGIMTTAWVSDIYPPKVKKVVIFALIPIFIMAIVRIGLVFGGLVHV